MSFRISRPVKKSASLAAGAPLELTVVTGEIMMPSTVHSSPTLVTVRQRSFTAAAGLFTLKGFLHYCFRCWLILPPLSWVAPTTLASLLPLPCLYRFLLRHKEERTAKSTRTTTQIKEWLWSVHVLLTFLHRSGRISNGDRNVNTCGNNCTRTSLSLDFPLAWCLL